MDNKKLGIYFIAFALLYFPFTVFVADHGIHFTNSAITVTVLLLGIYFMFKDKIQLNTKRR